MSQCAEWLIEIDPSGRTARLVGEFDISNTAAVREALSRVLDPRPQVVVDLGGVTLCSAALLGCLIDSLASYARRGATLALDPVSAHVRRVLDITDTASLFLVAQGTA